MKLYETIGPPGDDESFNNLVSRTVSKFVDKLRDDMARACSHMDPDKLTTDQKAAIAILAGVPFHSEAASDAGREFIRFVTAPCCITVLHGRWIVASV